MRPRAGGWVLVAGLVEIVLGLIAIVWPAVASVSIAILLGVLLLISGGVAFVTAFAARGWHIFGRLVWSLVSGLGGLYLLVYPDEGLVGLTALLVIVMFLTGTAFLALGLFGGGNRGLLLGMGAIDILVGVFIWAELPSSASWALGLLLGFHLLARGVETTTFGLTLRRHARAQLVRHHVGSRGRRHEGAHASGGIKT
jgi:uncharacterized membrane protein HdeD (DUF308 family)